MEFNFLVTDGRPETYTSLPPPSNVTFFTEQALRVGYPVPNFGIAAEYFQNPNPMQADVQRELEKEQIRAEIIAAETERRRVLEEEVRRELMAERQMAFHRGSGDGYSMFSGFEPRHSVLQHHFDSRSLEERIISAIEQRFSGNGGRHGFIGGGLETVPPFQRVAEPRITEVKPTSEVCKEKIIFLAKPEGNSFGTKRKAATPPAAGATEPPSVVSKKKHKEEWSCALCQVSTTSEQGLNEHLQGKKHKSKEAGLVQKAGKNYATGLFPKKTAKPIKHLKPPNFENLEQLQKANLEDSKPKTDLALVVFQDTGDSKNKNGDLEKMRENDGDLKKKKNKERFKFWCEMCQVGAFYEKVMNKHKMGKKHVGRLLGLEEKSRSSVAPKLDEDEATKVGPKDEE